MSYEDRIPPIKPDDIITASWLNRLRSGVEAARTVGGPDTIVNGAGTFYRKGAAATSSGLVFMNVSAQTIPAYGVVKINGAVLNGTQYVLSGSVPSIYGSQYHHFINGPSDVLPDELGRCFNQWGRVKVLYDYGDGTPVAGELWGPRNGDCKLHKNTPGFSIFGEVDDGNGASGEATVVVVQSPFLRFLATADTDCAKGLTFTASILYGEMGSYLDTGINMDSVVTNFADVTAGDLVECVWEGDLGGARWSTVAKEC